MADFREQFASYFSRNWRKITWFGIPTWKCPFDLWIMQELLSAVRPDYLVETGTAYGGSTLYYAGIFDLMRHGEVITIDDNSGKKGSRGNRPVHDRITYITGSSVDEKIVDWVYALVGDSKVFVDLDSCHSEDHVYRELTVWGPLVSVGSYMVVEDTNLEPPGPMEAVARWLPENPGFQVDRDCEKLLLTFNPSGYLKRVE